MTSPAIPPSSEDPGVTTPNPRPIIGAGAAIILGAVILLVGMGYCGSRIVPGFSVHNETNVSHDVVVSELRAVAKLVSSEATVRDVVTYENTWYGSTKRSLVVVTGRLT